MEQIKKATKTPECFFICVMVYMELIFQCLRFGVNKNAIYKILFAIFYGLVFGSLVSLLQGLGRKIVTGVLLSLVTIYFIVQVIYSQVFATYLSVVGMAGVAGQALDFTDVIGLALKKEWWVLVLYLLPLTVWTIWLRKWLTSPRHRIWQYGCLLAASITLFLVELCFLRSDKDTLYSAYEVYREYTSVNMSVEKLGVCESLYLDLKNGIKDHLGLEEQRVQFEIIDESATEESVPKDSISEMVDASQTASSSDGEKEEKMEVDTSPNVLSVDLQALAEAEENESIKALHEYIASCKPTNKNEYTGMFEGYNVIFVVAEGFSGFCVDEQRTPTLYKMCYEGFVFDNYYTPLWYGSTLGGEYADLTGLMPANGGYMSMARAGRRGNDMYFTLSEQLLREGYTARGYHDNDYTYYDRDISHPNMGLEWIGMGNGLSYEKTESGHTLWPQSDLSMIKNTVHDYMSDQPFYTYYLTVSGHVMYNFGGNDMAARHKELVENLPYSETTKAYIACQYELELAMRELVDTLEEGGVLDRTVIVLTADHVPYDNKEVVDELAGETLDSTFGWYQNKLIIWSASMEKPVYVSKYCSSLDVLPTVSNLLGLEYDSRMLVGQDILSDTEGLVIFNDRSFITDRVSYNANTGETISMDGTPVNEQYVEDIKLLVKNKFNMAEAINKNDYYRYIEDALQKK